MWTTRELKYVPVHGNGGSPVLVDDVLVVNCDGGDTQSVVALEQATGKIRWKTPRSVTPKKGFAFCTPLLIEVKRRATTGQRRSRRRLCVRPQNRCRDLESPLRRWVLRRAPPCLWTWHGVPVHRLRFTAFVGREG